MALDTARTIATLRGLTAKFDLIVQGCELYYPTKCHMLKSNGRDEMYGLIGSTPGVREWLGERQFAALAGASLVVANREWESSYAIERNDLEDDRLQMLALAFQDLASTASYHPDELLLSAQVAGTTAICIDGQPFYNSSHQWGQSGVQSNLLSFVCGTTGQPTEQEFRQAYQNAQLQLLTFKRDNGKLYNQQPVMKAVDDIVLEVPTGLQETAAYAIDKLLITQGQTNIVVNKPKAINTLPGLTDQQSIYLHRVGQPIKPFVFQERRPLTRMMKGLDDREFKSVKFMTDARYSFGYLGWWNSVKVKFN